MLTSNFEVYKNAIHSIIILKSNFKGVLVGTFSKRIT